MLLIDDVIGQIQAAFAGPGGAAYLGEDVTISEHLLQCAQAARRDAQAPALVVASLLHDIGYLIEPDVWSVADEAGRGGHAARGAAWLAKYFPPPVTRPVGLHVAAKRALCASDPAYLQGLSEASQRTLELQHGPMTPAELAAFRREPYANDALRLRRYDDAAKVPGLPADGIFNYSGVLRGVLLESIM